MSINVHKYSGIMLGILISSCASNSSNWMKNSKIAIESKNITELVIPGSHIANGYEVYNSNPICLGEMSSQSYSDNGAIEQYILKESPTFVNQELFLDKLNTQNTDISSQLDKGVRYLDVHICRQNNIFYTSNLYLTDTFEDIANQIKSFLVDHPSEIVILDLDNNLRAEYGYLNQEDIKKLHTYLYNTFGQMIIPKAKSTATIGELQNDNYQLIILSSNPFLTLYPDIWDKNQDVMSIVVQSSTIQTLNLLEILLNSSYKPKDKLTILPIYSDIRWDAILNENEDSEDNQDILLNYLQINLGNHPGIVVANKTNTPYIEELIIEDDLNSRISKPNESVTSIESKIFESDSITESKVIESDSNHISQGF